MKLSQSLISRFNHPNTLVVIGSYPQKGTIHDKNKDALASFTKNRILGLQKISTDKIIVITHEDKDSSIEEEDNLLIIRCFKKNQPTSFAQITKILSKLNYTKDVLIEFEFSTFGGDLTTLAFIPFLISLRSLNKNVTIELHQVLTRIEDLRGHLGYKKDSLKAKLFNPALTSFYRSIGILSHRIIVLEGHLKERLSAFIPAEKIVVLPHGVQKISPKITQIEAKKILGYSKDDFVVLSFGYLTWYKGSDLFVKAAEELSPHRNIKFVLAGGASHNQKHKFHYQKYFQKLINSIKSIKNLKHSDFIDEKDISLYYQAANLVVFPYRTFMSSSGPLSLSLSHQKPFILSRKLKPYLFSEDMNEALNSVDLIRDDLLFSTNSLSLAKKIQYLSKHPKTLTKLTVISKTIASERQYSKLAKIQKSILHSR